MSEQTVDEEFEAVLKKGWHEVTDSELWQWMPRCFEEVARGWGQPLNERISAARGLLMLAQLTPGDVVQAVQALRNTSHASAQAVIVEASSEDAAKISKAVGASTEVSLSDGREPWRTR